MSAGQTSVRGNRSDRRGGRRWGARAIAGLLAGAAAALAGCAHGPNPDLAGPSYPELAQTATLDIQVVRHETDIRLTNTTASSYKSCRLWLNRWYSRPIERLDVGQTLTLSLWDFHDEYGESFEAGGFFATRRPEKLVLAQLETGGELLGLVVVEAPTE